MDDYEFETKLRGRLISQGIIRPGPDLPPVWRPVMSDESVHALKTRLIAAGFITPNHMDIATPSKRVIVKLH